MYKDIYIICSIYNVYSIHTHIYIYTVWHTYTYTVYIHNIYSIYAYIYYIHCICILYIYIYCRRADNLGLDKTAEGLSLGQTNSLFKSP